MRRLHPINPAESVLFPFFDFGLLQPHGLQIRAAPGVAYREGDDMPFSWPASRAGTVLLEFSAQFDEDCSRYSEVFVHGAFPGGIRVQVELVLDDGPVMPIDEVVHTAGEMEFSARVCGKRLTQAAVRVLVAEDFATPGEGRLLMAGLADLAARAALYEPAFPEDWFQSIVPEGTPLSFEPACGIWFGTADMEAIRARAASDAYRPLMEQLRADAQACMRESIPEGMVWAKETRAYQRHDMFQRPHESHLWRGLQHPARACALVGLIDRNAPMLRHAARCAMAMAVRPDWSWGYYRVAGTRWFGVPGQNAQMLHAMMEVLDWAGSALTPRGRSKCWDAAMRQGVGHVLHCMSRSDWLYHHNHGMHGAVVLCMAGVALAGESRTGGWLLETAEEMLRQTLSGVFLDDGATVEGPGYWGNVVAQCGILLALARHRNMPVRDYIRSRRLPEGILRTHDYFLTVMSNARDVAAGTYLPVNDSGWDREPVCRPEALAVAAAISGEPVMQALHARRLGNIAAHFEAFSMGPQLLLMMPPRPDVQIAVSPTFHVLERQGSLTCRRAGPVGDVRLNLLGWQGQPGGHAHEDKGSIILEVDGECLLADPGVTIYTDPRTPLLQRSACHNLLIPLDAEGLPLRQNASCREPISVRGTLADGVLHAAVDITPAWAGLCLENRRGITSADSCHITLRDMMRFSAPQAVMLNFVSQFPIRSEGASWIVAGERAAVRITPEWTPARVCIDGNGIDHRLRPLYRLKLHAQPRCLHELVTQLVVDAV